MNEVKGYAMISKNAKSKVLMGTLEEFTKQPVRVLDFGYGGGVMVINPMANAIAMFEEDDIISKFECSVVSSPYGDVICPPNLNYIEQMDYIAKSTLRKGGYNEIVKRMVIAASLHSKKFNDNFLFQKQ